jgi:hypothetical protein
LLSCGIITGICEWETNLGILGGSVDVLARQIAVKKVLTCTIIKGGAVAMYEPPVSSFANRAALVVVDGIGSVLAVKLHTRSVNF